MRAHPPPRGPRTVLAAVSLFATASALVAASPSAHAVGEVVRSSGALDTCLVGTWRERSETDRVVYNGVAVTVSGGAGRTLQFSKGGREVVNYAHATALTGTLRGKRFRVAAHGRITFEDRSTSHTLSFITADFSKFSQSGSYGAVALRFAAPSGAAPVSYRCSRSTQTQHATGYSATFVKVP